MLIVRQVVRPFFLHRSALAFINELMDDRGGASAN